VGAVLNEGAQSREQGVHADQLSRSAVWIFGAIVLGRALGFVRESALAYVYGVRPEVDALNVAQTIALLLFSFLGPAIWNAGIPVLSEVYAKDATRHKQHYRKIVWSFFHLIVIVMGAIMIIGYFVMPALIRAVAPGFDPAREQTAVLLTRAMLPVLLMYGLTGWASLVLQTQNRFRSTAAGYLPNNLIAIAGIFLSSLTGGIGLVAVSFMLGVAGQVLVQLPGVLKTKYKLSLDFKNADFIRIIRLAPSTIATEFGNQISAVVDRIFGSGLAWGSIASLGYGQRAFNLVTGVIQVPIVIVLFPKLSAQNGMGDEESFFKLLDKGLAMLAFLMIPASAGLMVLAVPITQLLFERGAFLPSSTAITASIVFYYAIGLPFLAWRDLLIRAFYARKDSRSPIVSTVMMVAANIGLNLWLVPRLGVKALAMGTSFGAIVSACISYRMIRSKYRSSFHSHRAFYSSLWKSLVATSAMVAVMYAAAGQLGIRLAARTELSLPSLLGMLAVMIASAAIAYILFSIALKSKENRHCIRTALSLAAKFVPDGRAGKARRTRSQEFNS
jgi:putative peptidoglycan lipid II flippase